MQTQGIYQQTQFGLEIIATNFGIKKVYIKAFHEFREAHRVSRKKILWER